MRKKTFHSHRLVGALGLSVLAAAVAVGAASRPAWAAPKKASADQVAGLGDTQVMEAIRKGVNFLLSTRKGDNWESGEFTNHQNGVNIGGETSLVLYALLHVGQGVQDEEELARKLRFSAPDLAPVVKYVANIETRGTYTAGLQASALALVPKGTEAGKESLAGLNRAKRFLLEAMGQDGGYAYGIPGGYVKGKEGVVDLNGAWNEYVAARVKNDAKGAEEAKKRLNELAKKLAGSFGGVRGALEGLAGEIRTRGAEARQKKDMVAAKRADDELAELNLVSVEMLRQRGGADAAGELAKARQKYAEALKQQQTGGFREVTKRGPDGKELRDKNGKEVKERVPKTKEELQREVDGAKKELEKEEFEFKNKFNPIGDLSNGQYGTLGAWALLDYDVELPNGYWAVSDRFWRLMQQADGGWPYSAKGGNSTDTMTVAGIASLFITAEQMDSGLHLEPRVDKELDRGLAWLNKNFKPNTGNAYYMYGVERVGLASGLKFFGTTNWYKEGAANIIAQQSADGSWKGGFHGASQNVTTAYNLLFLIRGRNPVAFNKLEYTGPWNARPRDNANITHWMSKKLERPINWQIVNLKVSAEEWLDSPLLLITGSKPLAFSPEEVSKIRQFINAGGIVFSTADGANPQFTESVRKLAGEVVDKKYEMRELKKDHPLFSNELWADIKTLPRVTAMSNGIREVWIHCADDMGASWQQRKVATKEHFEFPTNLVRYASGKVPLRTKLQPLTVPVAKDQAVRSLKMARVDYGGNNDPEPGAWPRLAKIVRHDAKTDLTLQTSKLADLDPSKTPLAHMTGTTTFPVNAGDAEAVRRFVEGGGTFFADAGGGSTGFAQSMLELLKQAFPQGNLVQIPATSPLLNGTLPDGADPTAHGAKTYRPYYRMKVRGVQRPQLQGIQINGRWAVIYSAEDITSGLLGTNTWGILGYSPEAAIDLAQNIVLYAIDPKAGREAMPGEPTAAAVPEAAPAAAPAAAPKKE